MASLFSNFGSNNTRALLAACSWRMSRIPQRDYRPRNFDCTVQIHAYKPKGRPNRHWNQKFAHMRVAKVLPVNFDNIPDYDKRKEREGMSMEEFRSYMKKEGIPPSRPYKDRGRDRPIHVACSNDVFEAYIPPEGDGRASRLSREGVGQVWDQISSKSRELIKHTRSVKRYDEYFNPKTFGEEVALPNFIAAHKALMDRDVERLHELITEHAFTVMHEENRLRTVRWEFIESIEPARVVHVRAAGLIHDDNIFGQVTVRMHTKQKLAIYDQFGRLVLGSNDVARDALEYVVFERHLVDPYGAWRLHMKITPKWLPPKEAAIKTFRKPEKAKKHDVGDVKSEQWVSLPDEGDKPVAEKI